MKILLKAITKKVIKDFFEVDVQYLDKLHDLQNDLPERMKIEKVEKLVANLQQALHHVLVLKKVDRVIKFNQNTCLKLYIKVLWYLQSEKI